tara:strand:+ start:5530 stop:5661 length:132 start_codon:yes stop_codon:yes gene_type:complete
MSHISSTSLFAPMYDQVVAVHVAAQAELRFVNWPSLPLGQVFL